MEKKKKKSNLNEKKKEFLTEFRSRLVFTHSLASLYSSINPMIYSVSSESMMEAPLRPPAKCTGDLSLSAKNCSSSTDHLRLAPKATQPG